MFFSSYLEIRLKCVVHTVYRNNFGQYIGQVLISNGPMLYLELYLLWHLMQCTTHMLLQVFFLLYLGPFSASANNIKTLFFILLKTKPTFCEWKHTQTESCIVFICPRLDRSFYLTVAYSLNIVFLIFKLLNISGLLTWTN